MSRPAAKTELDALLPLEAIRQTCRRHHVKELAAFGSVLRDDFNATSDIDLFVTFLNDDLGPWMSRLTELQNDLEQVLGRPVDLTTRASIAQSENYIRRNSILRSAKVIYAG
ncbi:MAG: nucleotidyltransferase domain-containing protein [Phycisphaeraceae bacterium]